MNSCMCKGLWARLPLLGHLAVVLCLCGCATSDDPHEGGFVSGVVGLASGGYEKRISDRKQRYGTEVGEQRRLMAEAEALRQERARIKASLHQAGRRLASMESKLRRAKARIHREGQATGSSDQTLHRLNTAEAKIAALEDTLNETRQGEGPVAELEARSIEIDKELDEIDTLIDLVSGSGF